MSTQPPAWPRSSGSVKRARERLAAGMPREMRPPHLDLEAPRPAPSPPRPSRSGPSPGSPGMAKSPASPQWPLQGTVPSPKRSPPQRPPRPSASRVPSMLDNQAQNPTPSFRMMPAVSSEEIPPQLRKGPPARLANAGGGSRAPLGSLAQRQPRSPRSPWSSAEASRASTTSSVGTIPDFPIPIPANAARKPMLVRPTGRRGPSSHYSHMSNVSPIPETSESPHPSHGSYASSAAIPENWGDESPGFMSDDYAEEAADYEGDMKGDDGEGVALIRSASMGKRAKPSMVTTRILAGPERADAEKIGTSAAEGRLVTPKGSERAVIPQMAKLEKLGLVNPVGAAGFAAARKAREEEKARSTFATRLDSGSSLENIPTPTTRMYPDDSANNTPSVILEEEPSDPKKEAMLGAFANASSLLPKPQPVRTPSPRYERMTRRPPRLDIDEVKEAEARGSMTSLPDLIRRATRLAYMIEKGKRPGSAMDLNDFPFSPPKQKQVDEKHTSGLSGILASFPAVGTPVSRHNSSSWPEYSQYVKSRNPDQNARKPRRRCCGMSPKLFGVVVLLFLVTIVAVLVPIKFLVLDKQKSKPTAMDKCQADSTTACQNGGSSTFTSGRCGCICTNGFTGTTCAVAGMAGCITLDLDGDGSNSTLGSNIPRLLKSASDFSIPLSSTSVLERFAVAHLSCSTENALVTFERPSNSTGLRARQESTSSSNDAASDTSMLPTPVETTTATTTTSTASATSTIPITDQILDFSRIAVLYILQEQDITVATSAQAALQRFFHGDLATSAAQNVSVGGENVVDLVAMTVDLGEGTVGGGASNDTAGSSVVRRGLNGVMVIGGL